MMPEVRTKTIEIHLQYSGASEHLPLPDNIGSMSALMLENASNGASSVGNHSVAKEALN
jgi:hypothetical protein